MEASKVIDILITTATRLDMDETGSPVNQTMYKGITGSFLYLTASRPNIVFSVGLCARFQSNPKGSHLKVAKRILRYLKGTQDLVLYYPSGGSLNLIGYADVDYAGSKNSVALSIAEAEYIAAASYCAQLLWIKQQLEDFGTIVDSILGSSNLFKNKDEALESQRGPLTRSEAKKITQQGHWTSGTIKEVVSWEEELKDK
ncbi:secreted RxLR effector protein 161-like [Nicotiana tabacum]|uniref:Secreted RxLR effector protein 161-like n=1 Tax=Nicotiana tabacum TaxID=4097 RepID=A0AC58RP36_TOBAC